MKQKRDLKILGLSLIAVFAFSALASANASASAFKTSGTGELKAVQTSNTNLTTGGGEVICTKAAGAGTVTTKESSELEITVNYSGCTAFGLTSSTVSPATLELHANGEVDILNTITINVPIAGCSVTIPPQKGLKSARYANDGGKLEVWLELVGIKSKGSGGICGGESTTGTLTGHYLLELVGGTIEWVA